MSWKLVVAGREFFPQSGTLTLPRLGVWRADLELHEADVPTGRATLSNLDGSAPFVGWILRSGKFGDRARVTAWGGAGGLAREIPAQGYRGALLTGRDVANDALRAVGETLSTSDLAPEMQRDLDAWTRRRAPAIDELWRLADTLGCTLRVKSDGTVALLQETWADVAAIETADEIYDDPASLISRLALDDLSAELLPGRTYAGRQLAQVQYELTQRQLTVTLVGWRGPGTGDQGEQLKATIQQQSDHSFAALWPARVVSQTGATLEVVLQPDLQPEKRTMPQLTGVPLRGLGPGISVTVAAGARVLVGFEGADPRKPYALPFDTTVGNVSQVKLGANATKGVARLNDTTANGSLVLSAALNVLTVTYTPPGGTPQVTTVSLASSSPILITVPVGGTSTLSGKIDAASAKVLCE